MKITDLKDPYSRLAERRSEEARGLCQFVSTELRGAFVWSDTPEGFDFWDALYCGKSPEIPAKSLKELESEFVTPNVI